jgi:hypothetical protein
MQSGRLMEQKLSSGRHVGIINYEYDKRRLLLHLIKHHVMKTCGKQNVCLAQRMMARTHKIDSVPLGGVTDMNTSSWWSDVQKGEASQPAAGLCTGQIACGRWEATPPPYWLFSQCSPNTRPHDIPLCPSSCRSKHSSTSSLDGGERSLSRSGCLVSGTKPQYSFYKTLGQPHSPSSPKGEEKIMCLCR